MGVINLDTIISKYGGEDITNTYLSISKNYLTLKKVDEGKYSLETTFELYLSKDAKLALKNPLSYIYIAVELEEEDIKGNLYKKLYKELKKIYKKTRDD